MRGDIRHSIWTPSTLRNLIEHWKLAGLKRLQGMREDFLRLVRRADGARAKAGETQPEALPLDRPLRRWPPEELEKVKAYLEAKGGEQWPFDDHLLAIEWIHQKWWPADEVRTVAQWEAAKAIYGQRIRHLMAFHGPLDSLIEQEAQRRQNQLFRTYRLPVADFERLVIPVVLQHPCSPDSFDQETVARLWRTISPSQSERRGVLDELGFWPIPLEVTQTAARVGRFAQVLLAARAAGHQTLQLHVSACSCRRSQCGDVWAVDALLQSLEGVAYPALPPPQSRCRMLTDEDDECRAWCEISVTPMDRARQPAVDPAFERELDEIADRHWAKLAQQ